MTQEIIDRIRTLAEPMLRDVDIELVEIQYRREGRGWVLRLYIDKEGGVTLEDCTHVSHEINRHLDVEDFIFAPYTLEVSSPGLSRPLKTEKDFLKYRNHRIKVMTCDPIEKRRQFKGTLLGFFENQIEMELDEGIVTIPLSNVVKAHLEIEF